MEYWDNLNEVLEKKYFVRYEDDPARLKHEEIRKELETGRPFTGSRHPVSAPLEEGDASISRALDAIARSLLILTGKEDTITPKGNKKLPDLVPARIMEKMAWVQRCDYAVTKLYGACRVDEFCKLCKTSPYLERYISVSKWNNGYIECLAKYSTLPQPVEEYIDLRYIASRLGLPDDVFKDIGRVTVK